MGRMSACVSSTTRIGGRATAAALTALLLSACRPAATTWYPLDASSWWVFRVESRILDETREARFIARNRGRRDGHFLQAHQGTGASQLSAVGDGLERRTPGQPGAAHIVLPQRVTPGSRWTITSTLRVIESRTFARQDRVIARRYPVTIEKTVAATKVAVDTPAGRFVDCLLITGHGATYVRTDRGNSSAEVTVETREWFAPGRGPVRAERRETSSSTFLVNGGETWELLDYGS